MTDSIHYDGREQTRIKHIVLQKYLERFARIVGYAHWDTITYVDCFSGPWKQNSDKYEDTSFHIALAELRKAKYTLAAHGRSLKVRCFFLEEDASAYKKLQEYADKINDAEIKAHKGKLEDSISEILDFVKAGGNKSFPFFFIDPTGWTGFSMNTIRPLLAYKPGEVLINFMMNYINRFIDVESTQESFKQLFGSSGFRERILGLEGQDRRDAIVREYSQTVQRAGGFDHVCSAIVLHPNKDRTHFNLIYATRNPKGVEVFKGAEKAAMEAQEQARADAEAKGRSALGQEDLFSSDPLPFEHRYYRELRQRYLDIAKQEVWVELSKRNALPYDNALEITCEQPLVWEKDLKEWIKAWVGDGTIEVRGLTGKERVPKRGGAHLLVLRTTPQ